MRAGNRGRHTMPPSEQKLARVFVIAPTAEILRSPLARPGVRDEFQAARALSGGNERARAGQRGGSGEARRHLRRRAPTSPVSRARVGGKRARRSGPRFRQTGAATRQSDVRPAVSPTNSRSKPLLSRVEGPVASCRGRRAGLRGALQFDASGPENRLRPTILHEGNH